MANFIRMRNRGINLDRIESYDLEYPIKAWDHSKGEYVQTNTGVCLRPGGEGSWLYEGAEAEALRRYLKDNSEDIMDRYFKANSEIAMADQTDDAACDT